MPKQAISVTLDSENLTWLRGRVGASGGRSVSDLLDQIVSEARKGGRVGPARSVVGSIAIDPQDPSLDEADAELRGLFDRSIGRPAVVRETRAGYRVRPRTPGRRG